MEWLKGQAELEGPEEVKDMVSVWGMCKRACWGNLAEKEACLVMRLVCAETEILAGLLE